MENQELFKIIKNNTHLLLKQREILSHRLLLNFKLTQEQMFVLNIFQQDKMQTHREGCLLVIEHELHLITNCETRGDYENA